MFQGRYRAVRLLANSSVGEIHEGIDQALGRSVAIKFLSAELLLKPALMQQFVAEVKQLAQLSHSGLITIFDVGYDGQGCYLVMELLLAGSAGSRVVESGPYPWRVASRMIIDCCGALQAVHAAGLTHGNLHPGKLLFAATGALKLSGFATSALRAALPADREEPGAARYLSPEQAAGRAVDGRSDLYALGAIYYTLLTGQPPFAGTDKDKLRQAHLTAPLADPRTLVSDIPEAVVRALRQATAKEPASRYQGVEELAADLTALLDRLPLHPVIAESSPAPSRRGFLASAALGALGLMGGEYYLLRRPNRRDSLADRPGSDLAAAQKVAVKKDLPPLKVGILHSLSGSLAVSEHPLADSALLAIEELNARGGVLGRQLKPVLQDGKSEVTIDSAFTRAAVNLLEREKVAVVFGGYGSSSRKNLIPYFEKYGQLLFYPPPYEGIEESQHVIYTGSTPNQLGLPAIKWCIDNLGARSFFLVGTDGMRARVSNAIFADAIAKLGGEVAGTHYALVGESQFGAVAKRILETQPQVIFNMLLGDSTVSFFRALAEADITPRTRPVLSFTLSENELTQLGSLSLSGHYVARTRFPEVEPGADDNFTSHFQKKYGQHRPSSDIMEASYYGVYLWAAAVEKAGSEEVHAVRQALTQQEYILGGVRLSVDPSTQHLWKVFQVGKIRSDNSIEVGFTAEAPLPPIPFPPPRTRAEWNSFSQDLYKQWGGNWANPQKPQLTTAAARPHRHSHKPG